MARRHYANALVNNPNIEFAKWMDVARARYEGVVPKNRLHRIAKSTLNKIDINQYLLSHATIVASVDTFSPKNVKLGRQLNRGVQIDVRFPDFRTSVESEKYINNNRDAWSRPLLLSTYRTFVGAHVFVEHIQLPELSKGFIVDAIARDLGDTVYVDILTATDRKHARLIDDILSCNMNAYSMGCISQFTICNKCGNVAVDDASTCPCVQYDGKGSKFLDEDGVEHVLCELIGHAAVPDSNQFIEASWVKHPAFEGAVHRQFLNQDLFGETRVAGKIQNASRIHEIRKDVEIPGDMWKQVASTKRRALDPDPDGDIAEDAPPDEDAPDDADAVESPKDKPPAASGSSMDKLLDQAQEKLLQILVDKLGERLTPKPEDVGSVQSLKAPVNLESGNDNLQHSSEEFTRRLKAKFSKSPMLVRWASATWKTAYNPSNPKARGSLSPKSLIILSWIEDSLNGKNFSPDLYRAVIESGKITDYPSEKSYVATCRSKIFRPLKGSEEAFLVRKGRIASLSKISKF